MDTGDYCQPIVPQTLSTPIDSLDYNMSHKYRGFCLIFDHDHYSKREEKTKNLSRREGSQVDAEQLQLTFTKLGFHVLIRQNLTAAGIKETLKQVALYDHSESDCLVCFVLTHGDCGNLYAYDSRYPIDILFQDFCGDRCLSLVGKPKLFFIQACQGSRLDKGVLVSSESLDAVHYFKIPTYADFMIAYSTLPGFYSFRNTEKGSWFIRALVQVFNDYHLEYDLLTMMTMVCHKVAYYFSSNALTPALSGMKQVPCINTMLTRRVFLHPKSLRL